MQNGIRTLTSSDIAQVSAQKSEDLGAVGTTADGRRFRYAKTGGAVVAGNLVVAPSLVAGHQNVAVQAAAAKGATQVSVTLGAAAATQDQYAEGLLVVGVTGSGVPVTRKIVGNTAGASSGTITVFLDNSEPLLNALTTSNVVSLSPSRYNGVVASSTAGSPVGVAVNSIASGSFGWLQVAGPVGIVNDAAAALTALTKVKQSTTVAGAVVGIAATAAGDIVIGHVVQGAAASAAFLAVVDLP